MAGQKRDFYTIPPNFAEEGTLFSGRVRTRNALEAAFLTFVLAQMILAWDAGIKVKIYAGIILFIPGVLLSLLGVRGESLSVFLSHVFRYCLRRRIYGEPAGSDRLRRNRRLQRRGERQHRKAQGKRRKNTKPSSAMWKGGGAYHGRNRRAGTPAEGSQEAEPPGAAGGKTRGKSGKTGEKTPA